MKVTICIGSACHLKGSREIVQKMQELVAKNGVAGFERGFLQRKLCQWSLCYHRRHSVFPSAGEHGGVF